VLTWLHWTLFDRDPNVVVSLVIVNLQEVVMEGKHDQIGIPNQIGQVFVEVAKFEQRCVNLSV
jgi:hypothetical protein